MTLLARSLSAEHAPEWLLSRAKPETTLAGIDVNTATLADVQRRFGESGDVESDPKYPNEATYKWRKGYLTIAATTMFPDGQKPAEQHVYAIRVRGTTSLPGIATGAGIRLGDTFRTVIAKYGSRYQSDCSHDLSDDGPTLSFVFSDETELSLGFSADGKVVGMQLVASVE